MLSDITRISQLKPQVWEPIPGDLTHTFAGIMSLKKCLQHWSYQRTWSYQFHCSKAVRNYLLCMPYYLTPACRRGTGLSGWVVHSFTATHLLCFPVCSTSIGSLTHGVGAASRSIRHTGKRKLPIWVAWNVSLRDINDSHRQDLIPWRNTDSKKVQHSAQRYARPQNTHNSFFWSTKPSLLKPF